MLLFVGWFGFYEGLSSRDSYGILGVRCRRGNTFFFSAVLTVLWRMGNNLVRWFADHGSKNKGCSSDVVGTLSICQMTDDVIVFVLCP